MNPFTLSGGEARVEGSAPILSAGDPNSWRNARLSLRVSAEGSTPLTLSGFSAERPS
jgi:hypothetical protein